MVIPLRRENLNYISNCSELCIEWGSIFFCVVLEKSESSCLITLTGAAGSAKICCNSNNNVCINMFAGGWGGVLQLLCCAGVLVEMKRSSCVFELLLIYYRWHKTFPPYLNILFFFLFLVDRCSTEWYIYTIEPCLERCPKPMTIFSSSCIYVNWNKPSIWTEIFR